MILTIVVDFLLYTRFAVTHRGILADVLEVLCDLIHFISLEVRHNDIYIVAATIVHATQEHKLW